MLKKLAFSYSFFTFFVELCFQPFKMITMATENFYIDGDVLTEIVSGMQLKRVNKEDLLPDMVWISGWFQQPGKDLVIQHFEVLPGGSPSYALAGKAIDFWGREMLNIEQASATQMSGNFGNQLLIPAVKQLYNI